jgi:hypothetical protein
MKTKTFFVLCMIMFFAMGQLYGQGNKNGEDTRTIVYDVVWPIYILVENDDGILLEFLSEIEFHVREHYVNGEMKWLKVSCQGELIDEATGEVFWINDKERSLTPFQVWDGHFWVFDNIKGSQGSHYILHSVWNMSTWEAISTKLIIPGK